MTKRVTSVTARRSLRTTSSSPVVAAVAAVAAAAVAAAAAAPRDLVRAMTLRPRPAGLVASVTPTTAAVGTTKSRSEARSRARRLLLAAAGSVLVALVLLGCQGRSGPAPAPSARPATPPAPAGLVAELVVPSPSALYGALRSLAASRAPLLPTSPELALASVLGLPPQVAGALVLDRQLVGVAVVPEGAVSPAWVGACRVKSGAELS